MIIYKYIKIILFIIEVLVFILDKKLDKNKLSI